MDRIGLPLNEKIFSVETETQPMSFVLNRQKSVQAVGEYIVFYEVKLVDYPEVEVLKSSDSFVVTIAEPEIPVFEIETETSSNVIVNVIPFWLANLEN